MKLGDKVTVITGGGMGIGKAISIAIAKEGSKIVIGEVDINEGEMVINEIRKFGGEGIVIRCDVSNRDDVKNLFNKTIEKFGKVDILVNNAGIIRPAMLHKMTDEEWNSVIAVHLNGTFYCIQEAIRYMMGRKYGKIINVTSAAGIVGTIGQINYSAAKAGIIGVTKSAAKEMAKYNINVNCIAPAAETRMTKKILTDPRFREKYLERVPFGRFGKPEEIAPTVVFLASEDSNFITGQVICVDGGLVI
jgi:3-oxoacyl-[acyl-carrier protein] reductase